MKYNSLPPPQHHPNHYSICHRSTSNEIHNAHLYNTTRVIQLEILQHFRVQNPHATNYFWAFAGTIVIQNFGGSTREKCFRVARSDYVFFLCVAAGRFTYVSGGNFALRDTSCGNIGGRGDIQKLKYAINKAMYLFESSAFSSVKSCQMTLIASTYSVGTIQFYNP